MRRGYTESDYAAHISARGRARGATISCTKWPSGETLVAARSLKLNLKLKLLKQVINGHRGGWRVASSLSLF